MIINVMIINVIIINVMIIIRPLSGREGPFGLVPRVEKAEASEGGDVCMYL